MPHKRRKRERIKPLGPRTNTFDNPQDFTTGVGPRARFGPGVVPPFPGEKPKKPKPDFRYRGY